MAHLRKDRGNLALRAENVLKRAGDLIQDGQHRVALQALHSVVTNRRNRQWTPKMEEIMKQYLKLCVELKDGQDAKQGLLHYRTLCQQTNVDSFYTVITFMLDEAETKTRQAQEQAKTEAESIDPKLPENILLESINGESVQDRMHRTIVVPWIKFVWELYRNVLDVLKNSAKYESKYQDFAQRAFQFCLNYQRKTEFRRLCEMLRTQKGDKLSIPQELFQAHLDTRFKQLNVAITLDLWQDAYKSCEDIHDIMTLYSKQLKPSMIENYYRHLIKIFWVSKNYILHAYTWNKLFNLIAHQLSEEAKRSIASSFLLSVLSIPPESFLDADNFITRAKQLRMVGLLDNSTLPSKEEFINEIIYKDIPNLVYPELKDVYQTLEIDFCPFDLSSKMIKVFEFLKEKEDLKQYIEPLQEVTAVRILQQLAKVYRVMKVNEITSLISFLPLNAIERLLILYVNNDLLEVTIDHQQGIATFGTQLQANGMKDYLADFAKKMQLVSLLIHQERELQKQEEKKKTISEIASQLEEENKNILKRKAFIERMKKWEDAEQKRREQAEQEEQIRLLQQRQKEEEERRKKEAEQREKLRKQKELEEKKKEQAKTLIEKIREQQIVPTKTKKKKKKGKKGKKAETTEPVLPETVADVAEIVKAEQEQIVREQKEREKYLQDLVKNLDYLEIARRNEEIPKLQKVFEDEKALDKKRYDAMVEEERRKYQEQYEKEKAERERVSKFKDSYEHFITNFVMEKREAEFKKVHEEWLKGHNERKAQWEAKRKKIMEEIEKRKKQKEEEEKRRAEEERKKREEAERKAREEKERLEKLKRQEEIQRQRELEIERKLEEQRRQLEEKRAMEQKKKLEEKQEQAPKSRWGALETDSGKKESRFGRKGESRFGRREGESRFGRKEGESRFGRREGESRFGRREGESRFGRKEGESKIGRKEEPKEEKVDDDGFQVVEKKKRGGRFSNLK